MNMQELKSLIYQGEKIDVECKKAEKNVPKSAYESYSAFANTKGGYIILGVEADKTKTKPEERFIIQGIGNPDKQKEDFWNTINGSKVNVNILKDDDVFKVEDDGVTVVVIHVPRAEFNMRPVYVGENPYKGTYKRNHEGDYHATEHEIRGMIRDQNPEGNDSVCFLQVFFGKSCKIFLENVASPNWRKLQSLDWQLSCQPHSHCRPNLVVTA